MTNRKLLKTLKHQAESYTPSNLDEIKTKITLPQKKKNISVAGRFKWKLALPTALVCVLVLFGAIFHFSNRAIVPVELKAESYVSLDINPAVEFIVDENRIVISYSKKNKQAEIMLSKVDLKGMKIEDAINKVVSIAIDVGYIDKTLKVKDGISNAVMISAVSENKEYEDKIKKELHKDLKDKFKAEKIYAVVLSDKNAEDVKLEAEKLGVTVGKYELILELIKYYPEITMETAKTMSVKDINKKLENKFNKLENIASKENYEKKLEEIEDFLDNLETDIDQLIEYMEQEKDSSSEGGDGKEEEENSKDNKGKASTPPTDLQKEKEQLIKKLKKHLDWDFDTMTIEDLEKKKEDLEKESEKLLEKFEDDYSVENQANLEELIKNKGVLTENTVKKYAENKSEIEELQREHEKDYDKWEDDMDEEFSDWDTAYKAWLLRTGNV